MARPRTHELVEIGARLRAARVALGLSQAELARGIGVRPNTYNQWESGKRLVDPLVAADICDRFGITMDWIYRGSTLGLPQSLLTKITRSFSS